MTILTTVIALPYGIDYSKRKLRPWTQKIYETNEFI